MQQADIKNVCNVFCSDIADKVTKLTAKIAEVEEVDEHLIRCLMEVSSILSDHLRWLTYEVLEDAAEMEAMKVAKDSTIVVIEQKIEELRKDLEEIDLTLVPPSRKQNIKL